MFADMLRKRRKELGLSQNALAKMLYVSQQAVGKWETGTATPNPETIAKIAELFEVSTDYLLGKTKTPTDDGEREMSDAEIKDALVAEDPETAELLRLLIDLPADLRRQATDYVQYLASRKDTP